VENPNRYPVNLNLDTKLAMMAAIIYGSADINVTAAVDAAVALEKEVRIRAQQIRDAAKERERR
jgi:hypothetical protein